MTVKSQPYFWAECDAVGCDDRMPDGEEYGAFGSEDALFDEHDDEGWVRTEDGLTWCKLHRPGWAPCSACDAQGMIGGGREWTTCPVCDGDLRVRIEQKASDGPR